MSGIISFWGKPELADVEVAIREVAEGTAADGRRKRGREEQLVLPGHKVVLCGASKVLEAQIVGPAAEMAVQRRKSSGLPVVHLDVPPGQLEVGRQLLRCMYEQQPQLSSEDPHTLLQLLFLADKYDVPAVMAAVATAFSSTPAEQLPWEAVTAVYSLPATYADNAALAEVHAAAAGKLQHELGDLELVFADCQGQKQQQLQQLPHAAMQQLLRDDRTRVVSENTAAHAVLAWAHAQEGGVSNKQLLQLASLVRMSRCSQLYIITVLLQQQQLVRAVGGFPLQCAALCSSIGKLMVDGTNENAVQKRYSVWFKEQRPASAMDQLVIDWHVQLEDIRQRVEGLLQQGAGSSDIRSAEQYHWRGRSCRLDIDFEVCNSNQASARAAAPGNMAKTVELGVYLVLCEGQAAAGAATQDDAGAGTREEGEEAAAGAAEANGSAQETASAAAEEAAAASADGSDEDVGECGAAEMCKAVFNLQLMRAGSDRPKSDIARTAVLESGFGHGDYAFIFEGQVSSWQEVEQALRARRVVGAGGTLHIRAVVESLK